MSGASFHAIGPVEIAVQLGEITSIAPHNIGSESYIRMSWRAYGDRGEPAQLDLDMINAATAYRELGRILGAPLAP